MKLRIQELSNGTTITYEKTLHGDDADLYLYNLINDIANNDYTFNGDKYFNGDIYYHGVLLNPFTGSTDLSAYWTSAQTSNYVYTQTSGITISGITINASEFVTTGTTQSISGIKTFNSTVYMTSGLYVSGTTTFLNTEYLNVYNNYITLNSGETGAGVSAGFAGIEIDRGSLPNYLIEWSETTENFRIGTW